MERVAPHAANVPAPNSSVSQVSGGKKADLAVAASLLTAAYCTLKDDGPCQDLGRHHFERRNTPQLTRRLFRRFKQLGLRHANRSSALYDLEVIDAEMRIGIRAHRLNLARVDFVHERHQGVYVTVDQPPVHQRLHPPAFVQAIELRDH
jgi:hypothetical protein